MKRVMGGLVKFVKFLRLKLLRRKRVKLINRVSAVDLEGDQLYDAVAAAATTSYEQINGNNNNNKYSKGKKRIFSWDEIQRSTRNFSVVIGYGGFSTVYLADSSTMLAAVKVQCSSSERLNQAYKQELEILLHLFHPNIVKFLGHCHDREEGILIFEYVPNGNLQEKLHGTNLISWKRRMAIAFQLAQAMEYLHNKCGLQIVHGDIKSSNILLDENFNCKLCDFGSAKMGFTSTVLPPSPSNSPFTRRNNRIMMLGSPGYMDPHYLRTGLASKKNDVYSFGVVVLELITGMEAFNPSSGEKLTVKAEPMLRDSDDPNKVVKILDPRLRVDLEEAKAMAALSAMCLCDSPSLRPSASDILTIMRNEIPSVSFLFENKKTNL